MRLDDARNKIRPICDMFRVERFLFTKKVSECMLDVMDKGIDSGIYLSIIMVLHMPVRSAIGCNVEGINAIRSI